MYDRESTPLTVLIANPGADVYGSDLQMLESVSAMVEMGWRVVVAVPRFGPLLRQIEARGGEVLTMDFPVVRRDNLSMGGVASLASRTLGSVQRLRALISRVEPDVLYVNTVTIPCWLLAAAISRVPALCHVHEAENSDKGLVLRALYAQLLLAPTSLVNSRAAQAAIAAALPPLRRRTALVYNGVPAPLMQPVLQVPSNNTFRLAAVCRLSPRKAPDVALEALALLRREGRDVRLEICGTAFDGYEWYANQLRDRASQPDLVGSVTFSGYQSPVWPALDRCDAFIAPSLREPFGNAVVEAQLALRPVIASAALGHLETVAHERTGLLVPPGDAQALADAVIRLMDDPALAGRLAAEGRRTALDRFSVARYGAEVVEQIRTLCKMPTPTMVTHTER